MKRSIPVIDLFAGPGGLSEGFSAATDIQGEPLFSVHASIERDRTACRTLHLRAVWRLLRMAGTLENYYRYVRGEIGRDTFLELADVAEAVRNACQEVHNLILGQDNGRIDAVIRKALQGTDDWVLTGGPPCQAYSLAGRSRRINVDPDFGEDHRHLLYREYLGIIRRFRPAVFIMENVKGMLSSRFHGEQIFKRILDDLSRPGNGTEYEVRSLVHHGPADTLPRKMVVIRAEEYGVPQMRHRVILLGVRADRASVSHRLLESAPRRSTLDSVIGTLPPVRSRLSQEPDSHTAWHTVHAKLAELMNPAQSGNDSRMYKLLEGARVRAGDMTSTGDRFIQTAENHWPADSEKLEAWIRDSLIDGILQHETRSHMRSDLQRYLYCACHASLHGISPILSEFPEFLKPLHRNALREIVPFNDRFRVQVAGRPSTTIVSHIAKDGHYYIHPDPAQCRSLTVREAARLQTFPDNYYFEGNRTEQYTQIGNAVPPYLALQIARIVGELMGRPVFANTASPVATDLLTF